MIITCRHAKNRHNINPEKPLLSLNDPRNQYLKFGDTNASIPITVIFGSLHGGSFYNWELVYDIDRASSLRTQLLRDWSQQSEPQKEKEQIFSSQLKSYGPCISANSWNSGILTRA